MQHYVADLLEDPASKAHGVFVGSAFRPPAYQAKLYADAEAECRRNAAKCPASLWVAPPWHSNHGPRVDINGRAVPLGVPQPDDPKLYGIAVDDPASAAPVKVLTF